MIHVPPIESPEPLPLANPLSKPFGFDPVVEFYSDFSREGILRDLTSNGNHGADISTASGFGGAIDSNFGSVMLFDGVDDYLDIGTESNFDMGATGSFSVWIWFSILAVPGVNSPILDKTTAFAGAGGGSAGFSIQIRSNGKVRCAVADDAPNAGISSATPDAITLNAYHQAVLVCDRTSELMRFYFDNVQIGSAVDISAVLSLDNAQPFKISDTIIPVNMCVGRVGFIKRVLTPNEIKNSYNARL